MTPLTQPAALLLLLAGAGARLGSGSGAMDGLYPADSPVYSLSSAGLAYAVQRGSPPTLVEFYAEWCGHCQHYAPTYVRVAERMAHEAAGVTVAAINCPTHNSDCAAHGIHSYPTLKLFGAPADSYGKGLLLGPSQREPEAVVQFVRKSLPDLGQATFPFDRRRAPMKADANASATRSPSITNEATMPKASPHSASGLTGSEKLRNPDQQLVTRLPTRPQRMPIPAADVLTAARWSLLHEVIPTADSSSRIELVNSFEVGENGLEVDEPAALQRFSALQLWLQALHRGLPREGDGGMAVASLAELMEILRSRKQRLPSAKEWESLMKKLAIDRWGVTSTTSNSSGAAVAKTEVGIGDGWQMCSSSTPARHAYPCGLWLLFHTLMAHAEPMHAMQTLEAITGYVDAFFGCDECAIHFHNLSASMHAELLGEPARSRSRAVANDRTGMAEMRDRTEIWLWAAHNKVNQMLRHEITLGLAPFAEFAPYQWPSRVVCPECYDFAERSPSSGLGEHHHRVLHYQGWVDGAVLDFLHGTYCLEPHFTCWGEHKRWAAERAAAEAYARVRYRIRNAAAAVAAICMLLGAVVCCLLPAEGEALTRGDDVRARARYFIARLIGRYSRHAKAEHVI